MPREVMFTGSVPLAPAMSVYRGACDHGLAPLMRRIPDGEQAGWGPPIMMRFATNEALEPDGEPVCITNRPSAEEHFHFPIQTLRLKPGHSAAELMLDDMGIAANVKESYAQFVQAKAEGVVAPETRFVATFPGPSNVSMMVHAPHAEMAPVLSQMYRNEIAKVAAIVPHEELAIQFDIAADIATDELRRAPGTWDSPMFESFQPYWSYDGATSLIAEIANAVPEAAELGFHLCSFYHCDESAGQDLNVHVDWANTLTAKINRPITYVHMPTTAEYTADDFAPLTKLKLGDKTKLYIGLIHAPTDGLEGAKRRIEAAKVHRQDFGIASLCGLRVKAMADLTAPLPIEDVFDLHRQVAELD